MQRLTAAWYDDCLEATQHKLLHTRVQQAAPYRSRSPPCQDRRRSGYSPSGTWSSGVSSAKSCPGDRAELQCFYFLFSVQVGTVPGQQQATCTPLQRLTEDYTSGMGPRSRDALVGARNDRGRSLDRPLAYGSSFCVWSADQGTLAPAITSCATSTTIASRLGPRALNGGAPCPVI
jgi:hypothetical protein